MGVVLSLTSDVTAHQTLRIEDGAVEEEEEEMDPFTAKLTGLDVRTILAAN